MAPKVTASEMMKSHITSFFEGMAKGRASMTSLPCPPTTKFASLKVPPLAAAYDGCILCVLIAIFSQFDPDNEQKINPKASHEVPVVRHGIEGAAAQGQDGAVKLVDNVEQAAEAPEDVDYVDAGEHVEEGTVGIAG